MNIRSASWCLFIAMSATVVVRRTTGQFPVARVPSILTGEEGITASHGSREMPVWGPIFHDEKAPVDLGPVRLNNLVNYLESIQVNAKT